uniref:Alpha-carbonic anhydrase domain-containing protein n=1 Tax=Kalanchoe fedtschenkoi TaxID=63787 RepID=A0A7N0V8M2_KALFE
MVEWAGGAGWIRINSTNYKLQQSHWHSPSEHTFNGRRYAMELHMVHQTDDPNAVYKVAVVGMLYKLGRPDPFIDELLKNVTLASDDEHSKGVRGAKEVDPNEIRVAGHRYYRYIGSLTMPPCTEGVIWTINRKVRTVSIAQLLSFREAVHDYAEMNARPVQDLNSRWIYYHDPRD